MISRLAMKKAEVVIGRNQVILLCHHLLQLRAAQAEFETLDSFRSDIIPVVTVSGCRALHLRLHFCGCEFATEINVTVKAGNFVTFFAKIIFYCRKCLKVVCNENENRGGGGGGQSKRSPKVTENGEQRSFVG